MDAKCDCGHIHNPTMDARRGGAIGVVCGVNGCGHMKFPDAEPMGLMIADKMPNGQPCLRLPRGLVATMEAGSDAVRATDAAEIARRWNLYPDLLAACEAMLALAAVGRPLTGEAVSITRAAIARAKGV